MTQDRLKNLLDTSATKPPIQRGKPLELSTETSTLTNTDTSAETHHRTIAPSEQQYKRVNRGYKLREDLIKACKLRALEQDKMLYEVMEEALTAYLEGAVTSAQARKMKGEMESLARRLALEERLHKEDLDHEKRFRTDTEEHHFKKWLRSHDQPRGTDFFKRFLADSRLPQYASRGMYEAKMKVAGYSQEDIYLFQDAWKTMLFFDNV